MEQQEFTAIHPEDDGREFLDVEGNPADLAHRWRIFDHETWKYTTERRNEYPPIADYLDAIVKNDQVQLDAYIAKCQEIKAKYPKYIYRNPQ